MTVWRCKYTLPQVGWVFRSQRQLVAGLGQWAWRQYNKAASLGHADGSCDNSRVVRTLGTME